MHDLSVPNQDIEIDGSRAVLEPVSFAPEIVLNPFEPGLDRFGLQGSFDQDDPVDKIRL